MAEEVRAARGGRAASRAAATQHWVVGIRRPPPPTFSARPVPSCMPTTRPSRSVHGNAMHPQFSISQRCSPRHSQSMMRSMSFGLCHGARSATPAGATPVWSLLARPMSVKVTTDMIKELRAATGAPMMECKAALADPEVRDQLAMAVVGGASTGHPDIAPPWPLVSFLHSLTWCIPWCGLSWPVVPTGQWPGHGEGLATDRRFLVVESMLTQ